MDGKLGWVASLSPIDRKERSKLHCEKYRACDSLRRTLGEEQHAEAVKRMSGKRPTIKPAFVGYVTDNV